MKNIARLFRILIVIGKFRLDLLLNKQKIPRKYRLFLLPFCLFGKNKQSRGQRLRYALEELGPIFVKFGQILSTRPDLFPTDIIAELSLLQDNVTPFDNDLYKKIVEQALGHPINHFFESFSEKPLASASIAQVHSAVLKNGKDVVIKAVRPNISHTIARDIALLRLIAKTVERFLPNTRRLKPVEIVEDYRETILDELDLAKEAANASQLRRNFLGSKKLYIPEVYWDLCRENVMVMERIYGIPLSDIDALRAQSTDLKALAETGVDIFFTQVFDHNFFHADMHPGNVFVSYDTPDKPSYIAVDMAIIGSLTREDQYYLARNLLAMFRRDYRQVAELHVLSGWVPAGTSINGFESAIRSVCEPIFDKPLKDISFGQALISLFKTAQRFEMPVQPQLVLLQKTLVNIEGLGRQIYPELDLWETAHPFLERWVKNRYSPLTLLKDFKHRAPEWMEKFPEVPQLVLNSMKEQQNITVGINQLTQKIDEQQSVKSKHRRRRTFIGVSIIIGALANYVFTQQGLHLNAELLVLLAVLIGGFLLL